MVLLALVIASAVAVAGVVAYRAASQVLVERTFDDLDRITAASAAAVAAVAAERGPEPGDHRDDLGRAIASLLDEHDLGETSQFLLYQRQGDAMRRIDPGSHPAHPGLAALVASALPRGRAELASPRTFVTYRHVPACQCVVVLAVDGRELLAPLRVLRREVAFFGLGLAFLGIGVAYLASRRLIRRFGRLRRGVERIARGDLEHRIDLDGNDELTELSGSVDSLARLMAADISERERSQNSLLESEKQYRLLFEDSRDAILVMRPSGDIADANQATLDLLGYTRKQLGALHAREMFANPDDWDRFRAEVAKRASLRDFEARFRTKDGSVIDCLFTATAQQTRRGEITSYQSIIRDITKQKLSEKLLAEYSQNLERRVAERTQELSRTLEDLQAAQAQLVEAEKMAALGALVAGVAHEINTPVGIGVTAASTLADKTRTIAKLYDDGQMRRSDFAKYLGTAQQSAKILLSNLDRAATLISSFKQVAVDQSSEHRRAFAIQGYLQEVLLSLRPKLKRTRHTIDIRCDDSIMLESYPGAFSQIVTNLVMNSLLHAYGPDDEGQIVFEIHRGEHDEDDPPFIVLEYSDDGRGIPEDNLGHVFEPFFSTARGQGGSGLGLHIVYNLVTQRLGGTIRCESTLGSGTRFIIEIPSTNQPLRRTTGDFPPQKSKH